MVPQKPSYNLIFDLCDVIFSHHDEHRDTPKQFNVITGMAVLLHQIYAQTNPLGKQRHHLYVLSNASENAYHNFMTHHAQVFSYFQGIVVSAVSGFKKPDANAYTYLLKKYNLQPGTCIFIDDKEENVASAQKLGMQGIICKNPQQLMQDLKKYNIL